MNNNVENNTSQNINMKDDAYKILEMVNYWISNADTKVSYSLTFIGVVLGFFFTTDKGIDLKSVLERLLKGGFSNINGKETIILFLMMVFIVFSSLSIIKLYQAIKGRIDPKVYEEEGLITNSSNIFWGSIANNSYSDFHSNISNLNNESITREITSQIFINSKICVTKFNYYNQGVRYLVIAIITFFIYKLVGMSM